VSVRSNVDNVRNIKHKRVSLVTPVKNIEVGDTIDGIFKKVLILQDSVNDIDSTVGLQEAGYVKHFLSNENSYIFVNLVTGDQRKYKCEQDGLYHLVSSGTKKNGPTSITLSGNTFIFGSIMKVVMNSLYLSFSNAHKITFKALNYKIEIINYSI
jgi:hypothetical protein